MHRGRISIEGACPNTATVIKTNSTRFPSSPSSSSSLPALFTARTRPRRAASSEALAHPLLFQVACVIPFLLSRWAISTPGPVSGRLTGWESIADSERNRWQLSSRFIFQVSGNPPSNSFSCPHAHKDGISLLPSKSEVLQHFSTHLFMAVFYLCGCSCFLYYLPSGFSESLSPTVTRPVPVSHRADAPICRPTRCEYDSDRGYVNGLGLSLP